MFGKNRLKIVVSDVDLVNISGMKKRINEKVKFEIERFIQTS